MKKIKNNINPRKAPFDLMTGGVLNRLLRKAITKLNQADSLLLKQSSDLKLYTLLATQQTLTSLLNYAGNNNTRLSLDSRSEETVAGIPKI